MAAGPDQSASAGRFRRGAASTDHHVIITPPDASPRRIFRLAKSGPLRMDRPRVRDSLQTACGVQKPRRRDRACPRAAAAWPRVTAGATAPLPAEFVSVLSACCELSWAKLGFDLWIARSRPKMSPAGAPKKVDGRAPE